MTDDKDQLDPRMLSDYVDGELDEDTRVAVERHLAASPKDRARVRAYQAQADALHRAYASVLDEPVPDRLLDVVKPSGPPADVTHRKSSRRRFSGIVTGAMAASLALAVGGVLGWLVRGNLVEQEGQQLAMDMFLDEAVSSYSLYASADSPWRDGGLQVDRDRFGEWFQAERQLEVIAPDLSDAGYTFVGGRALPESLGAAGQVVYQDDKGDMIALYFRYLDSDRHDSVMPVQASHESGIFEYDDDLAAYFWTDDSGRASYAVLGRIGEEGLVSLGETLLEQLH